MLSIPITEQAGQQEWNIIRNIARNNGFPFVTVRLSLNFILGVKSRYVVIAKSIKVFKFWLLSVYWGVIEFK
jgi:hypothetical protein